MNVKILFPERRSVPEQQVIRWAQDAWANSAPKHRCCGCGRVAVHLTNGQPDVPVAPGEYRVDDEECCVCLEETEDEPLHEIERPENLEDAISLLEDLGHHTFAKVNS